MNGARWTIALLMLAAVVTLSVGETLIARGMRGQDEASWWASVRAAVTNGWVVGGVLLLVVHLVLYATALGRADLSLVMPLTAASYPLGTILARVFLHEHVHPARWIGTLVITIGVAVVAWGEARS